MRENGISFFGCTSVRTPRQGIHLLRLYSCYVQLGCQAPPGETCPSSQAGGFPARKPESGNLYIIPGFLLYFFQYSSFSLSFSESRLHRNLIIRSPFFSGQIRFSLSRSVSMNVHYYTLLGQTPVQHHREMAGKPLFLFVSDLLLFRPLLCSTQVGAKVSRGGLHSRDQCTFERRRGEGRNESRESFLCPAALRIDFSLPRPG